MKKIIIFLKNLKDRLYLEFIEILMQNDDPRRINQDLKEKFSFVKDFWSFINNNNLNLLQKVMITLSMIIFFVFIIYVHYLMFLKLNKIFR